MHRRQWLLLPFCLLVVLFASGGSMACAAETPPAISIRETFEPGMGAGVGMVAEIRGEVLLVHGGDAAGFRARSFLPLYKGDRVTTPADGRAVLRLADQSTVSLAAATTLVIHRALYDPIGRDRSTFLTLREGKMRCLVKNMPGYNRSEFKVKTPTLIVGVRGSDCIIAARADRTELVALKDTVLDVVSLADPDKSVVLQPYQRIFAGLGQPLGAVEKLTPGEAVAIQKAYPVAARLESVSQPRLGVASGPKAPVVTGASESGLSGQVVSMPLRIPAAMLAGPEEPTGRRGGPGGSSDFLDRPGRVVEREMRSRQEGVVDELAETLVVETANIGELPELPGLPE